MKKILIWIVVAGGVCIILLALVLTASLGSIIKKGVETVGPALTKTEMKLDKASVSAFTGSGTLHGFLLGNPEGFKTASAIKVGEIAVGVQPSSVLSDKIRITQVRVIAPEITFEGTLGTKNNLSKILENVEAATGGDKPKAESPKPEASGQGASRKLQVDDFLISGAKVNVSLTLLGGQSVTVPLPEIRFSALGTGPDGITAGELTKRVLSEVTAATLTAVGKAMSDAGAGATEALKGAAGAGASNTLNKATKGIGDLFKKK